MLSLPENRTLSTAKTATETYPQRPIPGCNMRPRRPHALIKFAKQGPTERPSDTTHRIGQSVDPLSINQQPSRYAATMKGPAKMTAAYELASERTATKPTGEGGPAFGPIAVKASKPLYTDGCVDARAREDQECSRTSGTEEPQPRTNAWGEPQNPSLGPRIDLRETIENTTPHHDEGRHNQNPVDAELNMMIHSVPYTNSKNRRCPARVAERTVRQTVLEPRGAQRSAAISRPHLKPPTADGLKARAPTDSLILRGTIRDHAHCRMSRPRTKDSLGADASGEGPAMNGDPPQGGPLAADARTPNPGPPSASVDGGVDAAGNEGA